VAILLCPSLGVFYISLFFALLGLRRLWERSGQAINTHQWLCFMNYLYCSYMSIYACYFLLFEAGVLIIGVGTLNVQEIEGI